jgi:CRP-like cAMP-binding protein
VDARVPPPAGPVPKVYDQDNDGGGETELLRELPATLDELAERIGPSRTTVYRRLVKLRDQGEARNRDGIWERVP